MMTERTFMRNCAYLMNAAVTSPRFDAAPTALAATAKAMMATEMQALP